MKKFCDSFGALFELSDKFSKNGRKKCDSFGRFVTVLCSFVQF